MDLSSPALSAMGDDAGLNFRKGSPRVAPQQMSNFGSFSTGSCAVCQGIPPTGGKLKKAG